MSDGLFQVEIISPERPLFSGAAGGVVAEAHDGEVGIERGHSALVTMLGTGTVRVRYAGLKSGVDKFAIRGGFLQVAGQKVSLLVTEAVKADEVDRTKVEEQLAIVKENLMHPSSDENFADLLDARRWFESQLRISA
ncbi:MAG: ATP synthase F1 subunit epsilon [Planctomycetota bacterium]|jgi:F-type H+-transporting ATPase subunit epsilon